MSLGKDLSGIRKELGLSLEEIQSSIKIPMLTLKSIENDSIFESTEHNQTYIRSFIRSYARALHLNDDDVVKALDAVEAGMYDHDLLAKNEDVASTGGDDTTEENEPFDLKNVTPPDIEQTASKPKPTVENVNWADLGKKFSLQDSGSKGWVLLVIILFVLALLATGFIFRETIFGFFESDPNEVVEPVENNFPTLPEAIPEADTLSITPPIQSPDQSTTEVENEDQVSAPPLSSTNLDIQIDTLTVAVYAIFDKLEPVRVTSDLNWRTNPFWMEQGEAYNFDFNDSLLVRGQHSRMLLLFNGHVIDNHRQYYDPETESVIITRSILDNSGYFDPAPPTFPYEEGPPDSLVYRINY